MPHIDGRRLRGTMAMSAAGQSPIVLKAALFLSLALAWSGVVLRRCTPSPPAACSAALCRWSLLTAVLVQPGFRGHFSASSGVG